MLNLSWWEEFGRLAQPDEPPLDRAEFWGHVSLLTAAMMGGGFDGLLTAPITEELYSQLVDAIAAVSCGARWDASRWASGCCKSFLADDDPALATELRTFLAGGLLPDDLATAAEAALERWARTEDSA